MTQMEDELVKLIFELIDEKHKLDTIIAVTGRTLDDGTTQLPSAGADPNKMWVTTPDGHVMQVWGMQGIKDEPNIAVEIRPNIFNELRIDRIIEGETTRTFGAAGPSLSVPDRAADLIREMVNTRRLKHMRVKASNPTALTVFVPSGYYEWQGVLRFWAGGAVTVTATATSNKHRMTLITLNRDTGALAVTNGDDFGTVQSIGESQLAAISSAPEHLRLAGVRVANGQTTITEDDIVEARTVFSQWPGYTIYPTTIAGEMTIPAGYRTADWVGSMLVTGKLTVHGGVRNIPRKVAA